MMKDKTHCIFKLWRACWTIILGIFLLALPQAGTLQTECPVDALEVFQHRICPPLVDDTTTEASGPTTWTHEPFCILLPASSVSREGKKGEQEKHKLCVYTSATFNGNRGISFLTTPVTAAGAVAAVQNPAATWRHRGHAADADDADQRRAYEIRPVVDKGQGVVATRPVRQFQVIMTAFPALIVDDAFFPRNGTPPAETAQLLRLATEQLGDRRRVLGLANSRSGDVVSGIVRTNAFGHSSFDGRGLRGLYPEVARINHGCDPNAVARTEDGTLEMSVIATRDIQAGEEIVISYIPLGLPSMRRTLMLAQQWRFHCACSMCMAFPDEKMKSDRRRERLMELLYLLQHESNSTSLDDFKIATLEFFDLVETEGLSAKLGEYYTKFMAMYFARDDLDEAVKYGELALKWLEGIGTQDGSFRVNEVWEFVDWLKTKRKAASFLRY